MARPAKESTGATRASKGKPVKIAVAAKQIPTPDTPSRLQTDTGTLDRSGGVILDEADSYSVEVAVRLVERAGDGEVVIVSMGSDEEITGLRSALAMGAHRAILVSDPNLAGSDALSTAKVLAGVVRGLGVDLFLAATESTDGYTGTVPVQVAQLLDLPSVSFATNVAVVEGELVVERQTELGFDEVRCPLPAVVSVTAGVVERRYPSFKAIMSAKSKPVEVVSLADLGISTTSVGANGARQVVVDVRDAPVQSVGELIEDDGPAVSRVLALLEQWGVLA